MGTMAFSAQYLQRPIAPGGNIIKRKWLREYEGSIPSEPRDRTIISWDIALSEAEKGDYSAGVVLLHRDETYSVLEVVRGRFPFATLKLKIMALKQRYGKSTLLIEDSPISKGLIQSLITEHRLNVVAYKPDTDKQARLIAQSDLFEGGSVLLPAKAAWREEFIAELLAFPAAPNDDQVDALTQGLAYGRNVPRIRGGYTTGHF
jgi:predicted phage terminase large subunit-like protein